MTAIRKKRPAAAPAARVPRGDDTAAAVRLAKALAEPTRLRMLAQMATGRSGCCTPGPAGRPAPPSGDGEGICVCEFQALFGLTQSHASYHLRVLRDAGLVRETTHGKWTFYRLDRPALEDGLAALAAQAGLKAGAGPSRA